MRLEEIQRLFKAIDVNKDGRLSLDELRTFLTAVFTASAGQLPRG